jgi:hypothetical protein
MHGVAAVAEKGKAALDACRFSTPAPSIGGFGAPEPASAPAMGGFGALNDDVLGVIAKFVGMRGATDLRATNKVLWDVVARVAWRSIEFMRGSQLCRWRACFPRATAAKVSSANDEDLQVLRGVTTLDLSDCRMITDEGLRHLGSVTTLDLTHTRTGCAHGRHEDRGLPLPPPPPSPRTAPA